MIELSVVFFATVFTVGFILGPLTPLTSPHLSLLTLTLTRLRRDPLLASTLCLAEATAEKAAGYR